MCVCVCDVFGSLFNHTGPKFIFCIYVSQKGAKAPASLYLPNCGK